MPLRDSLKLVLPPAIVMWRRRVPDIPDRESYRPQLRYHPLFCPWLSDRSFLLAYEAARPWMMLDAERAWIVWSLARQCSRLAGDFLEAGVYRGGSAVLIWDVLRAEAGTRALHLFDSFAGLPAPGDHDRHSEGDFADTSADAVRSLFGGETPAVVLHQGWIPETFQDCGVSTIAFAHVDVDLEQSVLDSCEFIYPRLQPGGVVVFDDYGFASCPGVRAAVDSFFRDQREVPLVLPTGQAAVFRLPA